MNYVKVQSSQIAEVGYDAETKTLGLKFPPNKKQNMEGLPGSEYHYSNVPPRVHRAMMEAESIGSYFGENIKKHPDLYPYEKVETENPLQPTGKVMLHSSGDMKNSKTDTAHSIPTMMRPVPLLPSSIRWQMTFFSRRAQSQTRSLQQDGNGISLRRRSTTLPLRSPVQN